MAILTRLKRLFRADVHAILDAVEEPEAVLKQAVREMQEALDLKRAGMDRQQRILAALDNQESYRKSELESVEKDLKFSLEQGSEELTRKTIGRKLACQKRLKALRQRIAALQESIERRSEEIDAQQAQLESIVEKAQSFVQIADDDSALSVAESILTSREAFVRGSPSRASAEVTDEEIELEWIRLRQTEQGGATS